MLAVVRMRTRVKKVLLVLKAEKANALLVWNSEGSGQPATEWLSGFTGTWSILLITRTKRFLIADGRYTAQSKKEAKGYKIFITSQTNSSSRILRRFVKWHKVKHILFDGTVTPYSAVEDLRKELSPVVFSSRKHILQELRIVKEKEELKLLSKAAKIACHSFTKLIPFIQVGMTEKEIARKLESLCLEEGADNLAFPIIVSSGKNGAFPHAEPTEKKIREGELITIDFGVRYKGYVSDMTRTVAVGKIAPRLFKMYEAGRIAQELGCKKAKAGITGQELDAMCRSYLAKRGFGRYFTHSTGHGIGTEVHELPVASHYNGSKGKLQAGAVITCEPGIYIPSVGGVRIEDALILTKKGNVNLTEKVTKKLIVL